ncbi:MAG: hypothetical protein ACQEQ4_07185 [Fibrobacterota bacterium]
MNTVDTTTVLQTIYFFSNIILLGFMFGIAQFYKKKLDSKAFSKGFLFAMLLLSGAMVLNFINSSAVPFLIGSAAALSIWNSIVLYYTMKQIRR